MYGNMTTLNLFGLKDILTKINHSSPLNDTLENYSGNSEFLASLMEALTLGEEQDGNAIFQSINDCKSEIETDSCKDFLPLFSYTSIREAVLNIRNTQGVLLERINNSTTKEARLGYVTELRDKIITAIREAGYSADPTDEPDIISVDGKLYDVIRNSKTLGKIAKIQFHKVRENGGFAGSNSDEVKEAILKASESGINLLLQIRASNNIAEREHLAAMIQQIMVDHLNANGYMASAVSTTQDQIIVNGVTYDVIRSLKAGGSQVQFQALRV